VGGLETLLPAGGVAGILVVIIGYLLNANRVDRREYRQDLDALDGRLETERRRYAQLQLNLDEERDRRRTAESTAARAVTAVERATDKIAALEERTRSLEAEVRQLRGAVT